MATNTISISGTVYTATGPVNINDSFANANAVGLSGTTVAITGTTAVTVPATANGFYYKSNLAATTSVVLNGNTIPLVSIGFQPLVPASLATFNVVITAYGSGSVQILFV